MVAEKCIGHQSQLHAQLGIVAQLGMRIERQVVGEQIDVVGQQQRQTLLHPARHAAVLAPPEQSVVHKNGIGACLRSRCDQRPAGGYTRHETLNVHFPLNLQAVGAMVLKARRLQQRIKGLQQIQIRYGAHGPIVSGMVCTAEILIFWTGPIGAKHLPS